MTEAVATIHSSLLTACQFLSLQTCRLILWCLLFGTGHVPLKCHSSGRRLMFLPSRMHGKGEVQTRAAVVSQSVSEAVPCPHPWPTAPFLHMPKQRLRMLQLGLGPSLSCTPHPLYAGRQTVFIVQRDTLQPADGGLPRPRAGPHWETGARLLGDSLPHEQGSPHYHCWGILLCAFCVSFRHIFARCLPNPKAWLRCRKNVSDDSREGLVCFVEPSSCCCFLIIFFFLWEVVYMHCIKTNLLLLRYQTNNSLR